MRSLIVGILCATIAAGQLAWSAPPTALGHLQCEQLHRAEHLLSTGDFAKCNEELQAVREHCSHPGCLARVQALEHQCEAKAMAALLNATASSKEPSTPTIRSRQTPQASEEPAERTPLPLNERPTQAVPTEPLNEHVENVDKPSNPQASPDSGNEVRASSLVAPVVTQNVGRKFQAPPTTVRESRSAPVREADNESPTWWLLPWTLVALMFGILSLQLVMWILGGRLLPPRSPSKSHDASDTKQLTPEADVFAQIMLRNVHLRRTGTARDNPSLPAAQHESRNGLRLSWDRHRSPAASTQARPVHSRTERLRAG